MAKRKFRFTVLDFVLILTVLYFIIYAMSRNTHIIEFNDQNVESEVMITLHAKGIDRDSFRYFLEGDSVYLEEESELYTLGSITDIRSAPSVVINENDTGFEYSPDFSKVDVFMEVSASCLLDRNGFCIVDGRYIAPSERLKCENGQIKFECEVFSVKITD